ncbi:MAG: dTDP-4-dehydrorhamnose reductase [Pirellulales bacterium]|nr:dTDP-4-dehydrorhamnose reductase [Pirellulales bacterium]
MKVAVVGARGQLGAELVELFRQHGDCPDFRAGDCPDFRPSENGTVPFTPHDANPPEVVALDLPDFDLTDRAEVVLRLTDSEPDLIVNAAAFTQVDAAETESDAAMAVNALGVENLADVCRALDCPLVHVSTDYVFGGDPRRDAPYRETDPPSPVNVYGWTKLAGERRAAGWEKHFIVRTCGLYGRGDNHFVATMLRRARGTEPLRVVADQHCTPSYVRHVARAIRYLAGTTAWGTYHVVDRGATTWYEFAREIFRLAGLRVNLQPIPTTQYVTPAPRPLYSVLDTAKYHALPSAPPMPGWEEALAEYLTEAG